MIRRWIALILAMLTASGCAAAEQADVSPALQTECALWQELSDEEIQAFAELMFAAAAGTTEEQELALRAEMTDEEQEKRNDENADYRARTLPWLIAVFQMEEAVNAPEQETDGSSATTRARQTDAADAVCDDETQPRYTTSDSYAAFGESEPGRAYLARLSELGGEDETTCLSVSREICALWMAQVDHDGLREMNADYACWICMPGTQIDYPVVHSRDNRDYMKKLFNGERNSAGTLFIDYRNLPDFQDPNTLIYGHHMRNGSMFGTLTRYETQAYFESHPFLLVTTGGETFLLEVFAGYTTRHDDHCYDIAISDEEDMEAFVEETHRKSDFASDAQIKPSDRLVTLSTCAYAFENARYIVIGRIVPVWEAPAEGAEEFPEAETDAAESDGANE